jgi:hypothetical protein
MSDDETAGRGSHVFLLVHTVLLTAEAPLGNLRAPDSALTGADRM